MNHAITYRGEPSEPWYRHYLLVVSRWLLQRGIPLDHVPRTRVGGRWSYVFDRQEDAEELAAKLRDETEDDGWQVAPAEGPPDVGPLRPLTLELGRDGEGVGFRIEWMVVRSLRLR